MTTKLTKRQSEVFYWLQQGASNKDICQRLNITDATVKAHAGAIMKKYGVRNRMQLILSTTKGQAVNFIPIEIEQEPVLWIQKFGNTLTGISTKAIDGWTPVYGKLQKK
jgi:DNA-binding CsgD family transcriptional regulator